MKHLQKKKKFHKKSETHFNWFRQLKKYLKEKRKWWNISLLNCFQLLQWIERAKRRKMEEHFFYCSVCWGKWNQVVENVGDNVRLYTVVNWAKHCHWHHKSTWKGNQERERDRQWGKNRFWVRESKQDVETFVSMSAKTRRHYTKTSSKVFTPPPITTPIEKGSNGGDWHQNDTHFTAHWQMANEVFSTHKHTQPPNLILFNPESPNTLTESIVSFGLKETKWRSVVFHWRTVYSKQNFVFFSIYFKAKLFHTQNGI